MAFFDKLGRGVAAFSAGVAAQLPSSMQQRYNYRQEVRYNRRLNSQEISARKQEIRALYNTGPVGREEALRQAGELNDPSFVAELQSTFPAREQERLQTASRSLSATTAGETSRATTLPIGSEQERATAVSESTSALGNISAAQSLMESLGGIKREPVSVDVLGQGPLPGNSISAQDFFGATDETKNAFLQAERAKEQLGARVGSLAQFEQDRRNIDPFTSPDDLNRIVDVLKQSYLSAGGTASQFVGVERQLRRELLSDRDAAFDDMAVIADDPNYIRELAVKWNVSPSMARKGEARAKLLETKLKQDVPENVRFAADQALSAWARGQELASHGQTDLARETLEFAADTAEGVNPRLAGVIRGGIEATLKTGTTAMAENLYQYWSKQLAEPFGDESVRRAIQATDSTFPDDGIIYIEDIWKAAQKAAEKGQGKNTTLSSTSDKEISRFVTLVGREFQNTSSLDSLDLKMLQFEGDLEDESIEVKQKVSTLLKESGWFYNVDENKFLRGKVPPVKGFLPSLLSSPVETLSDFREAAKETLTSPGSPLQGIPNVQQGLDKLLGVPVTLAPAATRGVMRPTLPSLARLGGKAITARAPFISSAAMNVIKAASTALGASELAVGPMKDAYFGAREELKREPTLQEIVRFYESGSALPAGTL